MAFGCTNGDEVDPNLRYELLPKNGVLTGCTDPLATNTSNGFPYDNRSCEYAPKACADCDFVVEPGNQVVDNNDLNLPPGSVIGIRGSERNSIIFRNFHGTPDNPYLIINCDAQVIIRDELPGIKLHMLSHVRLTGTGSEDEYGIKVTQARPFGVVAELGATDFEIDHIEITNIPGPAISARTRPVCDGSTNRGNFVQRNTVIHHNYLHDVDGEGLYIGGSRWHSNFPTIDDCPNEVLLEPELHGVRVYNNIVENVGQDGIQVGSAREDCEIYNNVVINYGLKNITVHQSGIQINPGTVGKVYSNLVKGGTGMGIFLNGFDNTVYSNLIIDCNKNAIHIGDRNPPPNQSYTIVNNTLHNIQGHAIYMNSSESVNNKFYNNLLINIMSDVTNKLNSDLDLDLQNNLQYDNITEANLINPDQFNYSPRPGSELIDGGATINNNDVNTDFHLNFRKVGQSIDIGAIEVQEN